MRPFKSHAAILLLANIAAACGTGDAPNQPNPASGRLDRAGVRFTTDRVNYRAGDPVGLTIVNQESDTLAYNACPRELEVRDGAEWVAAPSIPLFCAEVVSYVEPGGSRQFAPALDLGRASGEYRFALLFWHTYADSAEPIRATTNSFLIEP